MGKVASEVFSIDLKISARPDGSVRAAYLRIKDGKIGRTREVLRNRLLVDEHANGSVLGIEVLGPVSVQAVARLVPREQGRDIITEFAKAAMPKDLIAPAPRRSVNDAASRSRAIDSPTDGRTRRRRTTSR